jgi:hypothetical protein
LLREQSEGVPFAALVVRGDAERAAALARPRLAHGFGQTIHRHFGMTVERFSRRAEPVRRARQDPESIQDDFSDCGSSDR